MRLLTYSLLVCTCFLNWCIQVVIAYQPLANLLIRKGFLKVNKKPSMTVVGLVGQISSLLFAPYETKEVAKDISSLYAATSDLRVFSEYLTSTQDYWLNSDSDKNVKSNNKVNNPIDEKKTNIDGMTQKKMPNRNLIGYMDFDPKVAAKLSNKLSRSTYTTSWFNM